MVWDRLEGWFIGTSRAPIPMLRGGTAAVSTRKGGELFGYKLHLAARARTGLPLAWQVETARSNESTFAVPLGDAEPPRCAQGDWRFAGSDAKRGASKWRCPDRRVQACEPLGQG